MFDEFVQEAHRLKDIHADPIVLLVGLETEFITNNDGACLERLLVRHESHIEYLVGSVHHVNGIPIDFGASSALWIASQTPKPLIIPKL